MAADPDKLLHIAAGLEEALERRARLMAGYRAGIRAAPDLGRLANRNPGLLDPDVLAQLQEAAGGSEAPSAEQRQAARLAEGVDAWRCWCAGAAAEAEGWSALDEAGVAAELEVIPFRDALHELCTASDPVRRKALAKGLSAAWNGAERGFVEAAARRLEARGFTGPWPASLALDAGQLDRWAERVLALTRDATLDLLDFLVRKDRLGGRSSGLGWADLRFVTEMGSLREHTSPSQLWPIAAHLAEGMGLDPLAQGAISADVEDRPGRETGAVAVAFQVPGEIALLQRPARTPADLHRLFAALGAAHQLTSRAAGAPLEERALQDPSRPEIAAATMQSILCEPAWHRRVLRLPTRLSTEMARAFATRSLLQLRVACAAYLSARQAFQRGFNESTRGDYLERMSQATGGDAWPLGWLEGDPLAWACRIRGAAAAGPGLSRLREELDEDFWRNPRCGPILQDSWRSGGSGLAQGPGSMPEVAGEVEREAARVVDLAAR